MAHCILRVRISKTRVFLAHMTVRCVIAPLCAVGLLSDSRMEKIGEILVDWLSDAAVVTVEDMG